MWLEGEISYGSLFLLKDRNTQNWKRNKSALWNSKILLKQTLAKGKMFTGYRMKRNSCLWMTAENRTCTTVGQHLEVTQYSLSLWGKKTKLKSVTFYMIRVRNVPFGNCIQCHNYGGTSIALAVPSSLACVPVSKQTLKTLTSSSSYSTGKSLVRRMSEVYTI